MNNACRLCGILLCYSCCKNREMSENNLKCKEYQEGKTNTPSFAHIFMSKMGEILQKTDSSSSSHYYPNDRNYISSVRTDKGETEITHLQKAWIKGGVFQ